MVKNRFFYISAFISIAIYLCLVVLILLYITKREPKRFNSFKKDTVLELSIIVPQKKPKPIIKKHHVASSVIKHKIAKKIVKKSKSSSAKQKTNLKSLFANVKVKANKIETKKVNYVKKTEVVSRFKAKFEKQKETPVSNLSKILIKQDSYIAPKKTVDTNANHDKYISEIYDIIFQRWNPKFTIDGLSAKVIITINSKGSFYYKLIQYSGNNSFDKQLVDFLDSQTQELYPAPKTERSIDIEVTFKAKAK
jgi:hypothetical protein